MRPISCLRRAESFLDFRLSGPSPRVLNAIVMVDSDGREARYLRAAPNVENLVRCHEFLRSTAALLSSPLKSPLSRFSLGQPNWTWCLLYPGN